MSDPAPRPGDETEWAEVPVAGFLRGACGALVGTPDEQSPGPMVATATDV